MQNRLAKEDATAKKLVRELFPLFRCGAAGEWARVLAGEMARKDGCTAF